MITATIRRPRPRRAGTSWWKTVMGLLLTAAMLFPVYWMLNVSFTPEQDMRKSPPDLFPAHGTLDGYRRVLDEQLPYLATSLLIGLGTVVLTVALSAPAGYALAKLAAPTSPTNSSPCAP